MSNCLRACYFCRPSSHTRLCSPSINSYNMRGNRHLLSYRSIAVLDDLEAQELAGKLGLSPEGRRNRSREQNMVVRNGVLRRLEANDINFVTQETKIITDFAALHAHDDRTPKISEEERSRDIQNPLKTTEIHSNQPLKRSGSFVDEFVCESGETERMRDDYCRVWYQKLALQGHASVLQQESQRKDQLINQLRLELEQRGGTHFPHPVSQPHAPSHNKSSSHHPSFSINSNLQNTPLWAPIHPNRNFNIQPRNL